MTKLKIPIIIQQKVKSTIDKYSLIDKSECIIVAFSGGKDSTLTVSVLDKLGYNVMPVVIDMGYQKCWENKIATYANEIGIKPIFIKANNQTFNNSQLNLNQGTTLEYRLQFLQDIHSNKNCDITPCTECYNIKLLMLAQFAKSKNIKTIAYGHHGTDSIVSLLKSAFYHIDRWELKNKTYKRENFSSIVEQKIKIFKQGYHSLSGSFFFKKLSDWSKYRVISTDEPPVSQFKVGKENIKLIRPLFNIFEKEIIEFIILNKLSPDGSACGHGLTKESQTPREMVHRRIMDILHEDSEFEKISNLFIGTCKNGLKEDGTLLFDARRSRKTILGSDYKTNLGHDIKL